MVNVKKLNKKGSIQDLIFAAVVILVFSMIILIGFRISAAVNTEIQDSSIVSDNGKQAFQRITNLYPGVIDGQFLFLSFGLAITAFVMASLVRVHPIFLVLFILILIILIFISAVFSNIYQQIASNPDMITYADQLRFTSLIMRGLPLIVLVVGGMLAVVMYKVGRNSLQGF